MKVTMSVNNKHTLHLALEATMHIEAASRQRFFLSLQQQSVHNIIIYLLFFFFQFSICFIKFLFSWCVMFLRIGAIFFPYLDLPPRAPTIVLYYFKQHIWSTKHGLDICCGSAVRKFGLCDETVKGFEMFKHESGAENRSGESNRKWFL